MAQKIVKLGLKRKKNTLYYVGKDGNVWAAPMARAGKKGGKAKKIADAGVKKKKGYLYFLDKNGDVACTKMDRPSDRDEKQIPKEQAENKEFIAIGLFGHKIKLVSLTSDGTYKFLDEASNLHSILYIASSETLALERAVDELEALMNDPKVKEPDFQDFFERYPEFILSDDYKQAHPHVVLTRQESGEELIPDFVLEPVDQKALCDILELKLPSTSVYILKKRRIRYSTAVLDASAQLREYSRFFDEDKNRKAIQCKYNLLAYKPKMFVIIGRRGKVDPIVTRIIEDDLPKLCLKTYDDLIVRINARIKKMKKGG